MSRLYRQRQWYRKMERCASTILTIDPDAASVHFDDEFADCQAQSCTTDGDIGSIGPVKLLKKVRLLILSHADALVLHTDLKLLFTNSAAYPNCATAWGVFYRV